MEVAEEDTEVQEETIKLETLLVQFGYQFGPKINHIFFLFLHEKSSNYS